MIEEIRRHSIITNDDKNGFIVQDLEKTNPIVINCFDSTGFALLFTNLCSVNKHAN